LIESKLTGFVTSRLAIHHGIEQTGQRDAEEEWRAIDIVKRIPTLGHGNEHLSIAGE
jgi:hypothetical protein